MDAETLAAHRALLADKEALERFPLLRERPDWPPTHPNPSPNLSPAESREHEAFWQEVQRRQGELERVPAPQSPKPVEVPRVAMRQEGALYPFDASRRAAADFAALELALTKASTAAGHVPRDPRSAAEWEEVLRASNELKATFAALRAENERNRAFAEAFREKYPLEPDPDDYPVQGPDGGLLAPSEREQAERDMIAEVERPASDIPQAPHPERQPAAERLEAAEEVTRANHAPERDWLQQQWAKVPAPVQDRESQAPQRAPELEWLHKEWAKVPEREQEQEPERERERGF